MRLASRVAAVAVCLVGCSSTSAPPTPSSTPTIAPATASATAPGDLASRFRQVLGSRFNGSALVSRDGDVLFAVSTGEVESDPVLDTTALGIVAAELSWDAVLSSY